MDKEKQIRRNKAWRKVMAGKKQTEYWRQRWLTHPETMRSNLDRINRTRKEKAAERTQRLKDILGHCPAEIKSWNLRTVAEEAIVKAGYTLKANSLNVLVSAARRRKLLTYSPEKMAWMVSLA